MRTSTTLFAALACAAVGLAGCAGATEPLEEGSTSEATSEVTDSETTESLATDSSETERHPGGGGWGGGRGGWGGGGGSFSNPPKIYSRPAYSLNTDKPAGIYSKNPSYTRFDYLRPKVLTKGSREAYRREDF